MYYGEIKNCDIANGEGVRVTPVRLRLHQSLQELLSAPNLGLLLRPALYHRDGGLFALPALPCLHQRPDTAGGEPFEPENQRALVPFLRRVRQMYPDKTIWGFSGFTYEELTSDGTHPRCEVTDEMLSLLDVLVDGRFVEELKDLTLRFRGSSNQRLIDLNASRQAGCLCFLPDRPRGGR